MQKRLGTQAVAGEYGVNIKKALLSMQDLDVYVWSG